MEMYDNTLEYVDITVFEIALLSLDTKEAIIQDAMMDDEYVQLYKAV
jgi:hypothetical protein